MLLTEQVRARFWAKVDVRGPDEYLEGHLHSTVSAPGGQLVQTTDSFAATRNARICLIDDLVRRTGAGPPSSSYTEPLPRHRLPQSRICFPEADTKRRSTTVVDNELTPVADHDSQRLPRPSFSFSIGNVCIESLSSTRAVPILFIPTLQISWLLLFP